MKVDNIIEYLKSKDLSDEYIETFKEINNILYYIQYGTEDQKAKYYLLYDIDYLKTLFKVFLNYKELEKVEYELKLL